MLLPHVAPSVIMQCLGQNRLEGKARPLVSPKAQPRMASCGRRPPIWLARTPHQRQALLGVRIAARLDRTPQELKLSGDMCPAAARAYRGTGRADSSLDAAHGAFAHSCWTGVVSGRPLHASDESLTDRAS
jgi:hypothetical protein